jgi:hypothetical protein
MKVSRMFFVSGILVLASSYSVASGPEGEIALQRLFDQAKDLHTTRNEALASSYPDTECVNFSFKKSKVKIGFICTSKNKDFAREMGVSEYDALPEGSRPKDRPKSGLLVATPMRQYDMLTFGSTASGVASAVVDCDTDGAAIYRATSSCHVAVSPLGGHEVIYSNFVLRYHTQNKRGISQRRIKEIWQTLETRTR